MGLRASLYYLPLNTSWCISNDSFSFGGQQFCFLLTQLTLIQAQYSKFLYTLELFKSRIQLDSKRYVMPAYQILRCTYNQMMDSNLFKNFKVFGNCIDKILTETVID